MSDKLEEKLNEKADVVSGTATPIDKTTLSASNTQPAASATNVDTSIDIDKVFEEDKSKKVDKVKDKEKSPFTVVQNTPRPLTTSTISRSITHIDDLTPRPIQPQRNCCIVDVNNGIFMYAYNFLMYLYKDAIARDKTAKMNILNHFDRVCDPHRLASLFSALPALINPRCSYPVMTPTMTSKYASENTSISGATLLDLGTYLTLMNINQSYSTQLFFSKPNLNSPEFFFYVFVEHVYSYYKDQKNAMEAVNAVRSVPHALMDASRSIQKFSPKELSNHFHSYLKMCNEFAVECLSFLQVLSAYAGYLDTQMRMDSKYNEINTNSQKAKIIYDPYLLNIIYNHRIPFNTTAPTSNNAQGQKTFEMLQTYKSVPETSVLELNISGSGKILAELEMTKTTASDISVYSFTPIFSSTTEQGLTQEELLEKENSYSLERPDSEHAQVTATFIKGCFSKSYEYLVKLLEASAIDVIQAFKVEMLLVLVPKEIGGEDRTSLIKKLSAQLSLCQYKIKRHDYFKDEGPINISDESYMIYAKVFADGFKPLGPVNAFSKADVDKPIVLSSMTSSSFKDKLTMESLPALPIVEVSRKSDEWGCNCCSAIPGSIVHALKTSFRTLVMRDSLSISTDHILSCLSNLSDASLAELIVNVDIAGYEFLYPYFNIYPDLEKDVDVITRRCRYLSLQCSLYVWRLSFLAPDVAKRIGNRLTQAAWLKCVTITTK